MAQVDNNMVTPGGPDEEVKRDIDSEIEFLREIFPNFDIPVIKKVFEEKSKFDEAFKHLQEFFELVTTNELQNQAGDDGFDDLDDGNEILELKDEVLKFGDDADEEKKGDDDSQKEELSNELILVMY